MHFLGNLYFFVSSLLLHPSVAFQLLIQTSNPVSYTHLLTVKPSSLPQKLDKPALGPNYRLTMELELTAAPEGKEQVLLAAPEGELLAVMKDGTVGFRRDDSLEFSFGAKLPVGKKVKVCLLYTSRCV